MNDRTHNIIQRTREDLFIMKIGFDNDKYLQMQSAHIKERISQFDNKLYLEFGGKLFDDYHASRAPGIEHLLAARTGILEEDDRILLAGVEIYRLHHPSVELHAL